MPASTIASHETTPSAGNAVQDRLRALLAVANVGLVPMLDPQEQLFCQKYVVNANGAARVGISQRYTAMTLLGLREMELAGFASSIDMQAVFEALLRKTDWIQGVGDLGLLIWVVSVFDPGRVETLLDQFACESAMKRYADAREALTMETSWFLTGLCFAASLSSKLRGRLTDLAVDAYRRIKKNQGEFAFFGHMSTSHSMAGRLRGAIGSFADQVYPIIAMSKCARAFSIEEALTPGLECARAICRAQGELGQWWWLYDSRNGRIASRYPVYAVHQHGMAPMALFAAEEATGESFESFAFKGLDWIYGQNELHKDMREQNLIWRCIRSAQPKSKYLEVAGSLFGMGGGPIPAHKLQVLTEQWPYEYGWMLYGLARKVERQA